MERYYTAQVPALANAVPRLRSSPQLVAGGWKRVSDPQLSQWDVDISRLTALVARFQPYEIGGGNARA